MPYLRLDHINKQYATATVLTNFSLHIAAGEFISVLGPSGCGKTTLLNILAGITAPTSGSITLSGADITALPPEKRNFGIVFQNYALFPNLTVAKNIAYGLHGKEWNKTTRVERVLELMELTGIEGLEQRYPAELSGGQQQRVALARALAPRPSVLLLDEPLSALDAQVRVHLGQQLLHIQRTTGVTTIMVTHDQQEALALADKIVLMHQGKIEQAGTPDELYNAPASSFVASFIGHMNMVCIPTVNSGKPFGIRYENVQLAPPSEHTLAAPNTWVGRVEHISLLGAFYRVELLLNDFTTRLYADISRPILTASFGEASALPSTLVAVTLPQEAWHMWVFQ